MSGFRRSGGASLRAWGRKHAGALSVAALLFLVLLRGIPHVFFRNAHFDSDMAIFGVMGIDIAHGRTIPFYGYGQTYLLALEAWFAAPIFALFGPSVWGLKLPLLLMNAAVTVLTFLQLRKGGIGRAGAWIATLPLAVPSLYVAKLLLAAHGCNIEPFLGVLLLFWLRDRPVVAGVVTAVFYLNREFTLYGVPALFVAERVEGRALDWAYARRRGLLLVVMGALVAVGRVVGRHGPYYFGAEAPKMRLEPAPLAALSWLWRDNLLPIVGAKVGPIGTAPLGLDGHTDAIYTVISASLAALVAAVLLRGAACGRAFGRPRVRRAAAFPAYLLLVALASSAALTLFGGMAKDLFSTRYNYLALLGLPGLLGLCAALDVGGPPRMGGRVVRWLAALAFAVPVSLQLAYFVAAARDPSLRPEDALASYLVDQGYESGRAGYWTAYSTSFLARERVVLTVTESRVPIVRYEERFRSGRGKSAEIQDAQCEGGAQVARFWVCPRRSLEP